ncbi:hypothetical protein, partial [Azospirillum melinis]|uniref:hypothetical protein n=1 Tax=Azospirillum melinis TaxID=328839 RepID=UPI001FEC26B5
MVVVAGLAAICATVCSAACTELEADAADWLPLVVVVPVSGDAVSVVPVPVVPVPVVPVPDVSVPVPVDGGVVVVGVPVDGVSVPLPVSGVVGVVGAVGVGSVTGGVTGGG